MSSRQAGEFHAHKNGRSSRRPGYGKTEKLKILYERINRNGELTETENVIFYVSYGVLTEFLRMNVILTYFCNGDTATEERIRNAGNHA